VSHEKRIIVIGCGAGGSTAAQFARKTDRKAKISLIEKGIYPTYSKCGLPYVISEKIPSFNELIEFSEEWFSNQNIDLHLNTSVKSVDIKRHIVYAEKDNNNFEIEFNKLILATGAIPSIPPIDNIMRNKRLLDGVFVLRTIEDGKQISAHLKIGNKAVIIGAGLIGLEMADALVKKGMEVTIVETLPNILNNNLDDDMSALVLEAIHKRVAVLTNHSAIRVEEQNGKVSEVTIKDNDSGHKKILKADLLIIATGTKPEVGLAESIGCTLGDTNGIVVNEKCETSVENVYAVGDCTEYKDFVTGEPICIGLGSIVVKQAIAAGINAVDGNYSLLKGVLLTRTSDFFGVEIAAVGPAIQGLQGIPVVSGKFKGSSLPEYFPGGKPITMKLCADEKTGKILGAQAVGNNAAQRINTFACAVQNEVTVETFRKLETAYAPSVAPTFDVITLVCDVVSAKLARKRR
jgi:NADH oxidase (H2O2-forming)